MVFAVGHARPLPFHIIKHQALDEGLVHNLSAPLDTKTTRTTPSFPCASAAFSSFSIPSPAARSYSDVFSIYAAGSTGPRRPRRICTAQSHTFRPRHCRDNCMYLLPLSTSAWMASIFNAHLLARTGMYIPSMISARYRGAAPPPPF